MALVGESSILEWDGTLTVKLASTPELGGAELGGSDMTSAGKVLLSN